MNDFVILWSYFNYSIRFKNSLIQFKWFNDLILSFDAFDKFNDSIWCDLMFWSFNNSNEVIWFDDLTIWLN